MTTDSLNLQPMLSRLYAVAAKRFDEWGTKLSEAHPPGYKKCDKCSAKYERKLLFDATICASAENDELALRYEPCKNCFPRFCYDVRRRNSGLPQFAAITTNGHINWHEPFWSRNKRLWRQKDKRGSMHAWTIRHADSTFTEWRNVESMTDNGYPEYKRSMAVMANLLIDIDDSRGEGFQKFLEYRMTCKAAHVTWIIGGTDALDPIIPKEFLRV